MNPLKNRFEHLSMLQDILQEKIPEVKGSNSGLLRPDGTEVPSHWSIFAVDEEVVIKNYTFKIAYIGESTLLLEPVGVPIVGEKCSSKNAKRRKKRKRAR